jgi:hypothetical protein
MVEAFEAAKSKTVLPAKLIPFLQKMLFSERQEFFCCCLKRSDAEGCQDLDKVLPASRVARWYIFKPKTDELFLFSLCSHSLEIF